MTTDLQQLLKEIDAVKAVVGQREEDLDPRARAGHLGLIREAKEKLPRLLNDYGQAVIAASLGILIQGSSEAQDRFGAVAESEAIVVDAQSLYRYLAAQVEPSLGTSRRFGPAQVAVIVNELRHLAPTLGIASFSAPKLESPSAVVDRHQLTQVVQQLLKVPSSAGSGTEGNYLASLYLQRQIRDEALRVRYTQVPVPVVVIHSAEVRALPVFGRGCVPTLIDPEATIDQEYVLKVFRRVQVEVKKNKNKQ